MRSLVRLSTVALRAPLVATVRPSSVLLQLRDSQLTNTLRDLPNGPAGVDKAANPMTGAPSHTTSPSTNTSTENRALHKSDPSAAFGEPENGNGSGSGSGSGNSRTTASRTSAAGFSGSKFSSKSSSKSTPLKSKSSKSSKSGLSSINKSAISRRDVNTTKVSNDDQSEFPHARPSKIENKLSAGRDAKTTAKSNPSATVRSRGDDGDSRGSRSSWSDEDDSYRGSSRGSRGWRDDEDDSNGYSERSSRGSSRGSRGSRYDEDDSYDTPRRSRRSREDEDDYDSPRRSRGSSRYEDDSYDTSRRSSGGSSRGSRSSWLEEDDSRGSSRGSRGWRDDEDDSYRGSSRGSRGSRYDEDDSYDTPRRSRSSRGSRDEDDDSDGYSRGGPRGPASSFKRSTYDEESEMVEARASGIRGSAALSGTTRKLQTFGTKASKSNTGSSFDAPKRREPLPDGGTFGSGKGLSSSDRQLNAMGVSKPSGPARGTAKDPGPLGVPIR